MKICIHYAGYSKKYRGEQETEGEKFPDKEVTRNDGFESKVRSYYSILAPVEVSRDHDISRNDQLGVLNGHVLFCADNKLTAVNIEEDIFRSEEDVKVCRIIPVINDQCFLIEKIKLGSNEMCFDIHGKEGVSHRVFGDLIERTVIIISFGKAFGIFSDNNGLYRCKACLRFSQLEQISSIPKPTELSFISISCGNEHALLLSSDHRVFTIGSGSRGQLGNGSTDYHQELVELDILCPVKIVQIKAGGWHCLALSDSGDIYGWGWNESGQVGVSEKEDNGLQKLFFFPTLLDAPLDITFCQISAGSRHSAGVTTDGELYTWGWNGYGQLCHCDQNTRTSPTKVEFFSGGNFKVVEVVCSQWCTAVKSEHLQE